MIEGTIDCQEARGRFGGYLSGTESSEAAIQLESHLDECIDCRMAFEHRRESQMALQARERTAVDFERISQEAEALQSRSIASALRKQSLQQMLKLPLIEPEPMADEMPAAEPEATVEVSQGVEPLLPSEFPATPVLHVRRQWKPVAYAVALVSVLAAAILVSANSGAIFESPTVTREPGAVTDATPVAAMVPVARETSPAPTPSPEPADGVFAGETIGSNVGLSISTARPVDVAQPSIRPTQPKGKVRRKSVRRGPARRARNVPQGVRVYNP
jgi:hypothetical protein